MNFKPDTSSEFTSGSAKTVRTYVLALQILALALAYFAGGKLGALLSIQPGYATVIWPASGIALAGTLIFGYRVWPGVLIGAALVNLSISLSGTNPLPIDTAATISFAIGCGAALQAVIGAYLLRRFVGYPNPLAAEKEVFTTLFLGSLVSSLVNATVATSVSMAMGLISHRSFLANWSTWWLGDAMGILIFTPLVLVWALRPVEVWRGRRVPITLVMLTIFALFTALVIYSTQKENERIRFQFEKDSSAMIAAVEKSMQTHLNVLSSLKSFYSASDGVSREEFRTFVAQSFDSFHGVQALSWNPRILASERDAFEKSAQLDGYRSFHISELNPDNQLVKAGYRQEYVAVSYIEPHHGNESALGYDVYSDPVRKEAIERARDTGKIAITQRVNLVQVADGQYGVLAFMPVYRNNLASETLAEKRENIAGYVVAALKMEDVIAAALENINRDKLPYRLVDKSSSIGEQLISASDHKKHVPVRLSEKSTFGEGVPLVNSSTISIDGHQWQFEVVGTQSYMVAHYANSAWLILLVGLLLTIMVCAFVLTLTGRASLLRNMVEQRTMDLQASYGHFDKLSSQVPGAIYQFQLFPDGRSCFPYASVGIRDVYELTPVQVRDDAAHVFAILHPDDKEIVVTSIQKSASVMEPWRCEYRVNLPVKGTRWLLGQANPERLDDGSILWHGFITDITEQKAVEAKFRMLSTAVEQSPTSVVITNLDAEIEYVNPAFTKVTGYSLAEAKGLNPRVLQSGLTEKSVYPSLWEKIAKGQPWVGNFVNKRKNGEIYFEEAYISPVRGDDGTVSHYVAVKLDVTKRKQLEESIHAAALYTRSLIEASLDPLVTISVDGMITDVNLATENVTGVNRKGLIGTEFSRYFTEPEKARAGYQQVFAQGSVTGYMLAIQHVSGIVTDVLFNASVYRDEEGNVLGVFAAARDITDIKHMQEEMRQLAFYDPLTRLANRRLLIDRMSQAVAASKRSRLYGAVMFLDLDNFKPLNDTHGHGVGDLLLMEVAKRLKDCTRATDTVARIGGDEFVVMLTKLDKDCAAAKLKTEKIAEKIRLALAKPYILLVDGEDDPESTVEHHCTASIGVALFLSDTFSQDDVMKWADSAMYQAKDAGRNRVLFYMPELSGV